MRGPFKYGGGPFTVQIKDVSLGGGLGGFMGRGGGIDRIWGPPLEFWDPPLPDFGTLPPPPAILRFRESFWSARPL